MKLKWILRSSLLVLPFSTIALVACNDKQAVFQALNSNDFEVAKQEDGSMTIKLKPERKIATQLEVRYALADEAPTSASNFIKTVPSNLKANDIVWAKLFIRDNYTSLYDIKDQVPVRVLVEALPLIQLREQLTLGDFILSGRNGKASINVNPLRSLAPKLEVHYYRGLDAPSSDAIYVTSLSDIKNGDRIYIKLAVKSTFTNDYVLVGNTLLVYNVIGLTN